MASEDPLNIGDVLDGENLDPAPGESKMDPEDMANLMAKLQELRKKLADGNINPEDALKMLHNGKRRDLHTPTSYEYLLFIAVVVFLLLVFGKLAFKFIASSSIPRHHDRYTKFVCVRKGKLLCKYV